MSLDVFSKTLYTLTRFFNYSVIGYDLISYLHSETFRMISCIFVKFVSNFSHQIDSDVIFRILKTLYFYKILYLLIYFKLYKNWISERMDHPYISEFTTGKFGTTEVFRSTRKYLFYSNLMNHHESEYMSHIPIP